MINIEIITKYVAAAKEGDREAFTFLFNQTKDYTYSIAVSLISDMQEAQDIVQEVYLRVWLRLPDLREDRSFLRWLHSITFNIAQDHLRQRTQQQNALESAVDDILLQKTSFDEWFLRSWKQEAIREMVEALPTEQREAVYLFYFQDRTIGEIAVIQNCSINTVKSRLYYARNTLQKLIEAEEKRTGEMRMSPAVLALTSVMLLPMLQITLPHADSVRILLSVFAAAESMHGGMSFSKVHDESHAKEDGGILHRIRTWIDAHWIVRVRTSTVIALIAAVAFTAAGLVLTGRMMERRKADVDTTALSQSAITAQPVQTEIPTEIPINRDQPQILAQGACSETVSFTVTDDGVLRITGKGVVGVQEEWEWTALQQGEEQSLFRLDALAPYRETVTSLIVEEGITEIGYAAFSNIPYLTTVSLPDSCINVEAGAFYHCQSLTEIEFPPHVEGITDVVLKDCTALKRIVVSEDAEYIGSEAFSGCYALETVEFRGNALKEIGGGVFCNQPMLKTLTLPDSVSKIWSGAFTNVSMETLDLSNLTYTVIDGSAIRDSAKLKTLLLPKRMDKIVSGTVYNCPNLTTVILGSETKAIGARAFNNAALSELTIPASVSNIAAGAFSGNKQLHAIWVDEENPFYRDVEGVLFNRTMDTLHTYPRAHAGTSYILPGTVSIIANQAFSSNSNLTTLVIPEKIKILESQAISNLSALTGIYFQSSMPEIWADDAIIECKKVVLHCPASDTDIRITDGCWTAPDGRVYEAQMMDFGGK